MSLRFHPCLRRVRVQPRLFLSRASRSHVKKGLIAPRIPPGLCGMRVGWLFDRMDVVLEVVLLYFGMLSCRWTPLLTCPRRPKANSLSSKTKH